MRASPGHQRRRRCTDSGKVPRGSGDRYGRQEVIQWHDTFNRQIAVLPDADLLRAYQHTSGEPEDPSADALLAEIELRNLDV